MTNRGKAIDALRALRPGLEARGIAHVAIFGSVARDRAGTASDLDVLVTPSAGRRLDLIDLGGVQTLIEERFKGVEVDVVIEPVRTPAPGFVCAIAQDRVDVF